MKTNILIFILIVFVCMVSQPAGAYTQLTTYQNEPGGSIGYWLTFLDPGSAGTWGNVTYMKVVGSFGKAGTVTGYTDYPVSLKQTSCSGTQRGTADLTFVINNASPQTNVVYPGSTVEFKNINVSITTDTPLFVCNETSVLGSSLGSVNMARNNTISYGLNGIVMSASSGEIGSGVYTTYSGFAEDPIVNFIAYPLDGYSPLDVRFTAINITNSTGLTWTFGDGSFGYNSTVINHTYQNPGMYSVSMKYFNSTGSESTIVKTNYVLASIPSGMIVNLDVKNAITGALIQDSTVSIRNLTSGVWRNTTAPTGLVYFSTTDPGYLYPLSQGQNITLAANKSGYRDASETFAIPYNNYRARLFLMPTSVTNATGAGTVVVNVVRNKDGLTVSGMSVVADTGQIGVTNSAGAVTLYNVTAGARIIKVSDPDGAYQQTEKSITLTAGETKLVVVQVVLNGESPVDTPITPTTTGTFDPSDPASYGEYGNYTSSEMNQAGGFVILQMLGQLFSLWPLVVMGIFVKFMKSAFT